MALLRTIRLFGLIATLSFFTSSPLYAADTIGSATGITNEVTGQLGSSAAKLADGDPIFQNQLIATGPNSLAQFEFSDQTNLAVSENSSIVIDKHVFNPDNGTGEIALNAVGGAFRFVTGLVPKENIIINTPTATLGVRGTTFDLYVHESGEAAVSLIEGEVEVCNTRRSCRKLSSVGKVMHITVDGIISEARDWSKSLFKGVQYAAAFPFLATSKRSLNKAFYATGRAKNLAIKGGKTAIQSGKRVGKAAVKSGKKAGRSAKRAGRKARRATRRGGRRALRKLRRLRRR